MISKVPHFVIAGRTKDTQNYEQVLHQIGVSYTTSLTYGDFKNADCLILPGGGDISPSFYGQNITFSRNIDIELDILQLKALDFFVQAKKPVLGICKGFQLINVFFGGNLSQNLSTAENHRYKNADQYHPSKIFPNNPLHDLYGDILYINSAHHQGILEIAQSLNIIQIAFDGVIEGILHDFLPILGVQWHPERLSNGALLFQYFSSYVTETTEKEI